MNIVKCRTSEPGLRPRRTDASLNQSAVNLRDRSAAWQKSGWKTFDPASEPYDADEVRKERQSVWCWNSLNKNERPASAGRFHRAGATTRGGKAAENCSTDRAAILPVLWLGSTQPDRALWIDCLGWPPDGTDVAAAP